MSKGVQSVRRATHPFTGRGPLAKLSRITPGQKKVAGELRRFDKNLEKKGFFPESTHLQQKQEQQEQKEQIALRQQQETARLEESESEIARKRFLAKAGGRRSLIASR